MEFQKLQLIDILAQAVREEGYTAPTPIQAKSFPHVVAGRDLLGCAQTGTGKTAAFALPILQRLVEMGPILIPHSKPAKHKTKGKRPIRSLILTPTRELAAQIGEKFEAYGKKTKLHHTVIFGGVSQVPQVRQLEKGVDILIATPGRLMDLMNQGFIDLSHLKIFVLDEADRMLDMGFINDIRKIIKSIPKKRQTLLFSATMPNEIVALADSLLNYPVKVEAQMETVAADTVEQTVCYLDSKHDRPTMLRQLMSDPRMSKTLIFTRTKHSADRVAKVLNQFGVPAEAIHSNKSQNARLRALKNFKSGKAWALVGTDIAARGLDIDQVSHVINYDLPNEPETYVHRIGRTGRAGQEGEAISFCVPDQRKFLKDIEKLLGRKLPKIDIKIDPEMQSKQATHPNADKETIVAQHEQRKTRLSRTEKQMQNKRLRDIRDDEKDSSRGGDKGKKGKPARKGAKGKPGKKGNAKFGEKAKSGERTKSKPGERAGGKSGERTGGKPGKRSAGGSRRDNSNGPGKGKPKSRRFGGGKPKSKGGKTAKPR